MFLLAAALRFWSRASLVPSFSLFSNIYQSNDLTGFSFAILKLAFGALRTYFLSWETYPAIWLSFLKVGTTAVVLVPVC